MALATLPTAAVTARTRVDPVAQAMAAAGGVEVLRRVRAVAWSGIVRMMLGKTPVDLNIETRIEPFVRGRSDTWLASDGRGTTRTVMIERDGGFVVHEGAQTRLPPAQAQFERQQFGAYAYLLLAPAFVSAASATRLYAVHAGYPPITLMLARDGRIASADYAIAAPDRANIAIRQHLTFTGSVSSKGVRFPRSIKIVQDGRPLLWMTIADFSVELSAG